VINRGQDKERQESRGIDVTSGGCFQGEETITATLALDLGADHGTSYLNYLVLHSGIKASVRGSSRGCRR
jgi:hypothetical protein